ncbi:MAG UNVERIFIED_CONTAM: alanine racemase, partial [Thermobifida fusca]
MSSLRRRYATATAHLQAPFAIVDLTALRDNAADLVRRAGGTPIRVASKSVRCRALLREVLAFPGFSGIMAYTLPEALWLATDPESADIATDILVAYPTVDTDAIARLAATPEAAAKITLMVDSVHHLDLITAAAPDPTAPIRVGLDS